MSVKLEEEKRIIKMESEEEDLTKGVEADSSSSGDVMAGTDECEIIGSMVPTRKVQVRRFHL